MLRLEGERYSRGFFLDLAKQYSSGVVPLDFIETPREKALREYVERQKEARARRKEMEQESMEFEFEAWLSVLPASERDSLVPPNGLIEAGSGLQKIQLKEVFKSRIWPERRQQITEQGAR